MDDRELGKLFLDGALPDSFIHMALPKNASCVLKRSLSRDKPIVTAARWETAQETGGCTQAIPSSEAPQKASRQHPVASSPVVQIVLAGGKGVFPAATNSELLVP